MNQEHVESVASIERETSEIVTRARELVVVDDASYKAAGEQLQVVKRLRNEVAATFGPMKKKAHEAHKEILAQEKKHDDPLIAAERVLKQEKIAPFLDRREQEERAERARLEAEARQRDEDARLAEAANLEAAGEREAAERVLDEPAMAPPAPTLPPKPKATGVSTRKAYVVEVVDLMALVRDVAAGKAPINVLVPNESALRKMADALKGDLPYAGVKVTQKRIVSGRAA